jgi:tetratricopeptide (TPR) repeat protein
MKGYTTDVQGRSSRPFWSGAVIFGLVMTLLTTGATSLAAQEKEEELLGDRETQETASMREATYKELAKAQEAAEAENYSEAIRILDRLRNDDLNSYEMCQALSLYAYVYYSQDNYPKAIQTYEQLLSQPDLPEALQTPTVYTLSQLYFSTENWRKAIEMLNRWFELGAEPQPQTYELMAQAYYQLGEYRNALQPASQAIELTRKSGKPVKEQSYLLLRVLYYELEDYNQVAAVLQELIKRFPKKQYWMQLAGIYGELGNERKQISTLELAYLLGYLEKETEVMTLAGLLLQNDVPYKAGKILAKGLEDGVISSTYDHWRLLSQAWTLAQEDEKAVPALTRAAGLSEDGELDIMLGQTYMNLEQWDAAAQALRTGIRKGGLDRPDQAQVMLGQTLFNLNAFDEAREAFAAAQADRRSRQLAAQWLNYIDSEENRQAQLREALE